MITTLLLAAVAVSAQDPRPVLVDLQLQGLREAALSRTDEAEVADPDAANQWGLDYLRGHLLEALHQEGEAPEAFVSAMLSTPQLAGYGRYRLALNQYRMGHPEVAAGLLANLLANQPPPPLIPPAARYLAHSLTLGGDCRLLTELDSWQLPPPELRMLELSRARCDLLQGRVRRGRANLIRLLEENQSDDTGRGAANLLSRSLSDPPDDRTSLLLGMTFYRHREFEAAIEPLERGLDHLTDPDTAVFDITRDEAQYALARSHFWIRDYPTAASHFARLAGAEQSQQEAARALYQQARSYELDGDWQAAVLIFEQALNVDPTGRWSAAALLSSLRMHWRQGNFETALERYQQLNSRGSWRRTFARAALFLAASDLVSGEAGRAGAWLDQSARATGSVTPEIAYWRGRLAEVEGQTTSAVGHYVTALAQNPYHPLSAAARSRLDRPELAAARRAQGVRLAGIDRTRELHQAWILLGDQDSLGSESRQHLLRHMQSSSRVRPFLEMEMVPAEKWAIWDAEIDRPDEILLALGIVEHMSPAVSEHFPVADNSLALTASHLLAESGLYRQSLRFSEILSDRVPKEVPSQFLSVAYRRLLYPIPYRELIESNASSAGIEPHLLASIIREESRFDPLAISAASARGLTQFVLGTARRYGPRIGLPRLEAADLHRPEIAIALGAVYLADLMNRYSGRSYPAIAAYNAGEDQADLWQSYCYSQEPAEYFTKVGFSQTRGYLEKVVGSWLQYDGVYESPIDTNPSAADLADDGR